MRVLSFSLVAPVCCVSCPVPLASVCCVLDRCGRVAGGYSYELFPCDGLSLSPGEAKLSAVLTCVSCAPDPYSQIYCRCCVRLRAAPHAHRWAVCVIANAMAIWLRSGSRVPLVLGSRCNGLTQSRSGSEIGHRSQNEKCTPLGRGTVSVAFSLLNRAGDSSSCVFVCRRGVQKQKPKYSVPNRQSHESAITEAE